MALIELQDVSKAFGGLKAVDRVSLSVQDGQISGLIGPNGAGKTTLFNLISGFLPLDSGRIKYRSQDITKMPPHKLCNIGMVRSWQDVRLFYRIGVLDNILIAMPRQSGENVLNLFLKPGKVRKENLENLDKALSYLELVGLIDKAGETAQELSFAEQKLLSICRLLATGSDLLLLDEPMAGLDMATAEDRMFPLIRNLVETEGKTVCIVEHSVSVISTLCQWIFFLDHGKLIREGTPTEIMSDTNLGKIYFGV